MPAMADPNFAGTLTYICEHNEQGALGVVVNRPTDVTLRELFAQVDLELRDPVLGDRPVLFGGPVMVDRGFVLHRPTGAWQSTLLVADDIALTTSLDILRAVAQGEGPGESESLPVAFTVTLPEGAMTVKSTFITDPGARP